MALTAQQLADVRRFAGYPMLGDSVADDSRDFAYGWVSPGVWQTLQHRLTNMRPEEESILVSAYLTNLYALESAIPNASDNLDTDQAAVWKRNAREISDRTALLDMWRRRMCAFIGIAPGPFLGNGGISVTR
ncbi:hypothetical protein BUE93_20790 [Chromobacterium amazonense]|uniref:Uncharacterized protein n=1 Tax=Chromobacterium amazonense TaxID=1382803 RepID=A0A2S9WZ11_9NEIS|nr:hypothetical protein [Chromobacterium amazonense]PRP68705.1 hypothetical protein BUE93_20790 [Chromobacterium amazonense]